MKSFFAFSFAALLLSACGDDAATSKFTAASGTITAATATANKSTLESGAKLTFTGAPTNSPSVRREDDTFASCTTKNPTTEVDADSDQIKTQTRTFACNDVAVVGHTGQTQSRNGTVTVTDTDDSDAKSGWKFTYDMSGNYKSSTQTNTYDYRGFWQLVKDATSYTYSSDYKGTSSENVARAVNYTSTGGGTWSHKVTPVDMTNPYTGGGAIEFSGFYAYTFTVDSKQENYVFKMSSTGLKYGPVGSCNKFFKEGSYTYTDAANNTITYTFTDCDTTPTVKYNTTTI